MWCLKNVPNRWCTEHFPRCRNRMTFAIAIRADGRHVGSATDGARRRFAAGKRNRPFCFNKQNWQGKRKEWTAPTTGAQQEMDQGCWGKHLQHHSGAGAPLCCKVAICWQTFITARSHKRRRTQSDPNKTTVSCDALRSSHATTPASSVVSETGVWCVRPTSLRH